MMYQDLKCVIEAMKPIPENYAADSYWPSA